MTDQPLSPAAQAVLDACILELRARIEALEAAQQPYQDKMDRLIAIDRNDPGNSPVAADTFRALCAEIIDAHDADEGMSVSRWTANLSAVINRARAALAQPEPVAVAPTDEEIEDWHDQCADLTRLGKVDHYWAFDLWHHEVVGVVRAALARWGHQ